MKNLSHDCRSSFRLVSRTCWTLVTLVLIAASAVAQPSGFKDLLDGALVSKPVGKPEFSAKLSPASAKPGDEVSLTVTVKLPPKTYIYSTTIDIETRTQITPTSTEGLEAIGGDFQADRKPESKFEPLFNRQIEKFYGEVSWTKKFRISPTADPKNVAVELQVQGQYCSEGNGGTCTTIRPPVKLRASLGEEIPSAATETPAVPYDITIRPKRGKINPVEFQFQLAPTKSSGGKVVRLSVTAALDPEWHIFSSTLEGEGGTKTEITLDKIYGMKPLGEGFVPSRPPEIKDFPELGLRQEVYHDRVTWTREFEVLPDARPRAFGVEASIVYQTCKDSCLPPRSQEFVLGVTSDDVIPPERIEYFVEPEAGASVHQSRPQDKGLLVFLATAVGAALVALFTPCVFPMVPITVSFFLKQNESRGGRPVVLAWVFSTAIVASFVIIGVGIAAIFGATKPNQLANNWILNFFLASIFFAFALNMLGLFEIQVPSWLVSFTATGEQTGGFVGVIFMALTFVLTSFSCTFAFVGSLLAAAAQGEYYWPILGMLAFGSTFAAPFFALAMMPGTLKALPKSGGWLNAVKVVMGFVELGVAVKYISVVDQQWNSVPWLFDFTNVMTLWGIIALCTGLYLLGQFRLSHDTIVQALSPVRVLLAIAFLVLGGLFGIGVMQPDRESWVVNQLVAFAPARLVGEEHEKDFDKAVLTAVAQNRPLFVDFTGVFCVNCRLMEVRMARPKNHRRLEQFVQVQVYTDKVPDIEDPQEAERLLARNVALQENWFGDVTLPAYAVVTPDGKTLLSSYLGLEERDGDFARFLDEGLAKWQAMKERK
ncbi:protein-disulfide reductase DsbD family protein [Schlesneria sp. DSM 10557]|uniref:protein-disulfide reductase DsbD family protein n=1 Tax=Schlesneria sp. DSM 10557 TaxID=3044399 RepID=UPI0035A08C53